MLSYFPFFRLDLQPVKLHIMPDSNVVGSDLRQGNLPNKHVQVFTLKKKKKTCISIKNLYGSTGQQKNKKLHSRRKMQLDVEVSPPAFGWYHQWHYAWKKCIKYNWAHFNNTLHTYMTFCLVTFFLVWILVKLHTNRPIPSYMTFWLVTFFLVWILVKSQTDIQTYRQIAMHMSPQCIRTGGLKKLNLMRVLVALYYTQFTPTHKTGVCVHKHGELF